MSGETLKMLLDQLLLIEGLLLGVTLGVLLLRHRYLLNRRRREAGCEHSSDTRREPEMYAPCRLELVRSLRRVR